MPQTVIKETLDLTEAELQPYLEPKKSVPLSAWLDPDRYPTMGRFNLEDAYEYLPKMYQALADAMEKDADWRKVISRVVSHNEGPDKHLEKWLRAAKIADERRQACFYGVPFAPGLLDARLGAPPKNTLWSFYAVPLLLTKRPVEKIAIADAYRRKLDYTEFYSFKYASMKLELEPPPVLVLYAAELENPEGKAFTLIEGALRTAKAEEADRTYVNAKIVAWDELRPYIHIQPIKGDYHYRLADFSETQGVYV